ncbi:DeoR/GlpR transcriptional regulator [Candidatus Sumerlaeota bacterium]|nr:DeoR/GlpR transcriptional regulator [Candidatus Sumerlaeota bacterium]
MIAVERQQRIYEYVEQHRSAKVSELAELMSVTEETIRRDLDELTLQGRLQRRHGGAMAVDPVHYDLSFDDRKVLLVAEKQMIAQHALSYINEGDTLFLDASSTVLQLAKILPDMRLTVITNCYYLIQELAGKPKIRIVSSGGNLDVTSMSFLGPSAEKTLQNYFVDKLFISCRGLDLSRGASDAIELQSSLKSIMMHNAEEHYLLLDHTKFDKKSLAVFASVQQFDRIITDSAIKQSIRQSYRTHELPLEIAG